MPRPSRSTATLFAGTEQFQTVGDWLRFAVTSFTRAPLTFAQGLHGPPEEAMFLVGRHLGLESDDLVHFLPARLTNGEITGLKALIRARVERHVPVPYLVNEAVQGGMRFFVNEHVLIPRSYIAGLLSDAIPAWAGRNWQPRRILDLGTGSGCLAILAARAFPSAIVDAVDISPDALAVAEHNVASHDLGDRVHVIQSDVFSGVPPLPYDLIIANPPYEPRELVEQQPAELKHEPALALDGGIDGMTCVRRILREARSHLTPRGCLVLEHGNLGSAIRAEFPRLQPHVFMLPDGTDAVIGVRAATLPQTAPGRRSRGS